MIPRLETQLDNWINGELFNALPIGIAVVDRDFNVVRANKAFEKIFGPWENRKCYAVYRNRSSICPNCKASEAFNDGIPRVDEEIRYDENGRPACYIDHMLPVLDKSGNTSFLVQIIADTTEVEQIKAEHQLMFDQVPCHITILDRNMQIVKANKKLRETFGDLEGRYCFEAFKGLQRQCSRCTARQTFEDGHTHTAHHVWNIGEGETIRETIHSLVTTVPLQKTEGKVNLVMEMAVDISQELRLQDELEQAYMTMQAFIASSKDGIFTLDESGDVGIFNRAARELFQVPDNREVSYELLASMLPNGFLDHVSRSSSHVHLPAAEIWTFQGETIPVRLVGVRLQAGEYPIGTAFLAEDLREVKQLEREKLEAERLAAVGQTVAGLAHGIKNLITGLQGGLYLLGTGLDKGRIERIPEGREILERNVQRLSSSVKAFLSFAKGREISLKMNDPAEVAAEVVAMYSPKAKECGIELLHERVSKIEPAPIDRDAMHECLTNLVGNAMDACLMSEDKTNRHVWVRTFERDDIITYEVVDNGCGMDYEVKKNVFTSFFTTKGLSGTGLGLLVTRRVVQEHGGRIEMESELGKGSTFRINLPRASLLSRDSR